jgi:hypothetical protein
MRRDEFIAAVEKIMDALSSTKMNRLIRLVGRQTPEKKIWSEALTVYSHFMQRYSQFNENDKRVFEGLKLSPIINAGFWSDGLNATEATARDTAAELRFAVGFLEDYVPGIV